MADAILYRLVHSAHKITLTGEKKDGVVVALTL